MVLIKCPKCNHTVLSAASQCPSCGYIMDPEQRDVIRVDRRPAVWVIISGVAVAGLLALVVWRAQADGPFAGPSVPQATQPGPGSELAGDIGRGELVTSPSADADSLPLPQGEPWEDGVVTGPWTPPTHGPPPQAETLWTETWVNVRERPGTASPVVKVLTPGQPVDVLHPERRWSLVYVDGRQLGYLSVAFLTGQPPGP